jgi:hypothetical protein
MSTHALTTLPLPAWRGLLQAVVSRLALRTASPHDAAAAKTARELAAVRALADRYRRSDPGFASDLYAAAARYESSLDDKA